MTKRIARGACRCFSFIVDHFLLPGRTGDARDRTLTAFHFDCGGVGPWRRADLRRTRDLHHVIVGLLLVEQIGRQQFDRDRAGRSSTSVGSGRDSAVASPALCTIGTVQVLAYSTISPDTM